MNRIDTTLKRLNAEGRKALVTYIVSGDPHPDITLPALQALVEAGADIIELGVPFSDPMAEGPVIQRGHERALVHHVSLKNTLAQVARFRQDYPDTPVVLMGYANPIERMGYATFAQAAADAGVDGVLTVDLPPEEVGDFGAQLKKAGLHCIMLVAPTTTPTRMQSIAAQSSGFIYYVSLKGVTGAGHLDVAEVADKVTALERLSDVPVMVGFGIKDGDSAYSVSRQAAGVVVGSALVDLMADAESPQALLARLRAKVQDIRQGLDRQ
jgi:tryptophan synthase alpha chain